MWKYFSYYKKMKIASLTVAYNEEDLIKGCLELLDVDFKLIIIPKRTFSGIEIKNSDKTAEIAQQCGATVIYEDIYVESEIRNHGLKLLESWGYEYALIVDSDEYWSYESIINIKKEIENNPQIAYKSQMDFFFRRPTWKIEGMKNNRAIICMRTDQQFDIKYPRKFKNAKLVNIGKIYHFSYVRTPEKIKEKIESFSHFAEIRKNWYDKVYMNFTLDSKNFHPVKPKEYPYCIKVELPNYIINKIPKYLI